VTEVTEVTAATALLEPARGYLAALDATLTEALSRGEAAIAAAGRLLADRFQRDGLAYVFGAGHSHIMAEEGFYRAGGSARVAPMLIPRYMLHESAERETCLERETGLGADVLAQYGPDPDRDVLVVVSNSGANPLPVEVAQAGRDLGLPVVALTSVAYATASTAAGPRLHEVADIVLDNRCPPGDALVELAPGRPRVGPGSSIVGLALFNAVLVQAAALQWQAGRTPDIYISAGMPDAAAHNRALADRFRGRIRHI